MRRRRRKRRLKRAVRSLLLFSVMVLATVGACFLIPRLVETGEEGAGGQPITGGVLTDGEGGAADQEGAGGERLDPEGGKLLTAPGAEGEESEPEGGSAASGDGTGPGGVPGESGVGSGTDRPSGGSGAGSGTDKPSGGSGAESGPGGMSGESGAGSGTDRPSGGSGNGNGESGGRNGTDTQPEEVLADMTLEQKVLQLFVVTPEALTGFSGTVTAAGDATRKSILEYPVGGLIYFARNLNNPEQVKSMLENTLRYYEEAGYPMPFLAVDEEGGTVARIGGQAAFGVQQVGDMWDIGKGGDVKEAERVGTVIGTYLADLGFNLDFAPDADVLTNPDNKVIGKRSFGSDGQLVADMALAQLRGLESCGIYGALKHYPGHGATSGDTHDGYAAADRTLEELMEEELVPFAEGARAGVHFIMVSHIAVPAATGDGTPCTLSQYMITDILRNELGYEGIVITDAMNMGAISKQYGSGEAAIKALKAGVDIVLMPADFQRAYKGVLEAVESGELTEERIDESVRRILELKCGEN